MNRRHTFCVVFLLRDLAELYRTLNVKLLWILGCQLWRGLLARKNLISDCRVPIATNDSKGKLSKNHHRKTCRTLPELSSILHKISWPSNMFIIPWLFSDWKMFSLSRFSGFSRFSNRCGNPDTVDWPVIWSPPFLVRLVDRCRPQVKVLIHLTPVWVYCRKFPLFSSKKFFLNSSWAGNLG